jgi:hypothetical protein
MRLYAYNVMMDISLLNKLNVGLNVLYLVLCVIKQILKNVYYVLMVILSRKLQIILSLHAFLTLFHVMNSTVVKVVLSNIV